MASKKRKRKYDHPTPELAGLPGRLKTALEQCGHDAKTISAESGVDAGQLTRLQDGQQLLGVAADKLVRLARALDLPPAQLILGASFEPFRIPRHTVRGVEDWEFIEVRPEDGGTSRVVVALRPEPVQLPAGAAAPPPKRNQRKK